MSIWKSELNYCHNHPEIYVLESENKAIGCIIWQNCPIADTVDVDDMFDS